MTTQNKLRAGEMTEEQYAAARRAKEQQNRLVFGLDRGSDPLPAGWANGNALMQSLGTADARGVYTLGAGKQAMGDYIDKISGLDYTAKGDKTTTYEQAKAWADKVGGHVLHVPGANGGYYQAVMPYHDARMAGIVSKRKDWAPMAVAAIMTGGAAAGYMTAGQAAGAAGAGASGSAAGGAAAAGGGAAASYAIPTAAELSAAGYSAGGMGLTGAGGIGAASSVAGAGAGAAGYGGAAGAAAAAGGAASGGGMWEAIGNAAGKMSMGDWLNAASTVGGMYSSNKAAKAQEAAANRAADLQWKMYEQSRADQMPWLKTGGDALNKLAAGLGLNGGNGDLMRSFTAADFVKDPGYDFRMKEGQRALDSQFSRAGGLLSGAALKASSKYNQDFASNEYGNAYNRFNSDQANKYNRLASLANVGQVTANQVGNNAMQTGQIVGNSRMDAGNARASGYMGMSNALSGGVAQGYNMYQQNQMMNRLYGNGGNWWSSMDGVNANGGGF